MTVGIVKRLAIIGCGPGGLGAAEKFREECTYFKIQTCLKVIVLLVDCGIMVIRNVREQPDVTMLHFEK